ncbi:hypothetical protein [Undibacterium fentianense]|uniref:Uncharacterized protein n=1 Tax=Undibacterium fentianense TaxID=2828728 RepID=A0A941E0J0_9BURK|nr:hypothetical protein [Undibacterium fentianense]MBR7799116.1 hypothetical protein [Undibacterium fentianense]
MFKQDYSKKDRADAKIYLNELGVSMVLYIVTLFVSIYFGKKTEPGLIQNLIVMTPTIPAFGALWAIIRSFKRMDEYMRISLLEVMAIAGGCTAFFNFSYGFLEGIGFPRLSGFANYGIFMGVWLLVQCGRKLMMERE